MAKTRMTRDELQVIIDNYNKNGLDTTELEAAMSEAFHEENGRHRRKLPGDVAMEDKIAQLYAESPVTEGRCPLCGHVFGKLVSGVCEECFIPWATTVAKKQLGYK